MRKLLTLCCFALVPLVSRGEVVARNVEYQVEPTTFEGVLIYDNASTAKRPTVLVVHEFGAVSPLARTKAAQYARMGYAAFCVDMYGKGNAPKDDKDAPAKAGILQKDRSAVRARLLAALAIAGKQPQVDVKKIVGVGYGHGGTALLEMVRAGADVEGVICLHGDLTTLTPADAKKISASVLVLVGADDPQIPLAQVGAFEEEMRSGGVDAQVYRYGGVTHDFTNPQAGRNAKSGAAYDKDADERADVAIKAFFIECFPPTAAVAPKAVPKVDAAKGVPAKAMQMLAHVDDKGEAPDNYEGGRTFGNFERRLPLNDDKGHRVKYREWDVNPLKQGVNRGPERLVTGSDGSAYYTDDHYSSFKAHPLGVTSMQQIITLDGRKLTDSDSFHKTFAAAFGFPKKYGKNMDAWVDCMSDLDMPTTAMTTKVQALPGEIVVLRIEHADELQKHAPSQLDALMEAVAFVNERRLRVGRQAVLALAFAK